MSPTRLLLLLVAGLVLAVSALFWLQGSSQDGDVASARAEIVAGARTRPVPLEGDEPVGFEPDLEPLPSPQGVQREAAVARPVVVEGGRELEVAVELPQGAPRDSDLAVLAVVVEGPGSAAALLEDLRSGELTAEHVRAPVGLDGRAKLTLPEAWGQARLLLDGRFLYAKDLVTVDRAQASAEIEASLGAALTVTWPAELETEASSVSLTGGNFSGNGGGGWEARKREHVPAGLVFRALDPDKTWTLLPTFSEHHAAARMGIELEPGQELLLDVALSPGALLKGHVKDARGEPVANVDVFTTGGNPWMGGADERGVATEADGSFVLKAVPPGRLKLEASLEGWRTVESEELELDQGDVIDDILIVIDRGESLSGTVAWPDGQAAPGAEVRVEALRRRQGWGGWGGQGIDELGVATTDEAGRFTVTGLPEGSFTVRASRPGPGAEDEGGPDWRAVAEAVPAATQGLELVLAAPIQFQGRVIDDVGQPIPRFRIEAAAIERGGPEDEAEFEDKEGKFRFTRVGPGEWNVTATAENHVGSEPILLSLPEAASSETVFQLRRSASVGGRVLDVAGNPVAGAYVRVEGSEGQNPWAGARGPRTESDGEGRFLLEGLEPGPVSLVAQAEGWADSEVAGLEVLPGEVRADVWLTLRVGGIIAGGVVTPEGDPLVGRRVTWGSNAMGFGSRGETETDAGGRFVFERVTPGDWAVSAVPSMAEMGERMQGRRGDPSAFTEVMGEMVTETVTVLDGERVEVWLGGEPRVPVRIFGTVTMGGEALEGAQVYAVSEGSAVFQGMKSANVAADGRFELTVDRPGPYVVSARSGRLGVEVMVDVPRAAETEVDLRIPEGRIEGRVLKPDGGPASGVQLRIQRDDGLGRMRWDGDGATTDAEGRYVFESLEPGIYTVRANTSTWGGRANESWGSSVRPDIRVKEDGVTRGIDFELETAGSLEGLVRGPNGEAVRDVAIFFRDETGRLISRFSGTQSDANGRFRQTGLVPGEYTLSARADSLAALDGVVARVSSGEVTEVELNVELATHVVVRVEQEDGDLLRARVEVFDSDGNEVGSAISLQALRAAFNQGTSSLEQRVGPFPEGRYTVRATTLEGEVLEKRVRLRGKEGDKELTLKLK